MDIITGAPNAALVMITMALEPEKKDA